MKEFVFLCLVMLTTGIAVGFGAHFLFERVRYWRRFSRLSRQLKGLRAIGKTLLREEDFEKRKELWRRANLRVFELQSEIARAKAEIAKAEAEKK